MFSEMPQIPKQRAESVLHSQSNTLKPSTRPKRDRQSKQPSGQFKSTEVVLKTLKAFLVKLFQYEPIHSEDLQLLRPHETSILAHILESKRYHRWPDLVRTLRLGSSQQGLWRAFGKIRRKEENLKYGFKLVLKLLQARFSRAHGRALARFDPETRNLVFYLFHFYEQATGNPFRPVWAQLHARKNPNCHLKRLWRSVQDFILPEMGAQSRYSRVKSISKEFMARYAESPSLSWVFLDLLADVAFFMCFTVPASSEWPSAPEVFSRMHAQGQAVMRLIRRTNAVEIRKLFAEWDNRLRSHQPDDSGLSGTMQLTRVVKRGIGRKNFKFPWTLREVQVSFVDSLLAYLEVFQAHRFRRSDSGRL